MVLLKLSEKGLSLIKSFEFTFQYGTTKTNQIAKDKYKDI